MFSVWRFKVSAGAAVITVLLQNTCTCLHWVLMLVFQITIRSSYTILELRCHHHGRSNEGQQECGNGDCIQLINEEGNDQNILEISSDTVFQEECWFFAVKLERACPATRDIVDYIQPATAA